MVLCSDYYRSKMQAQLPKNPDSRPLPSGWVEHFDHLRKVWYYILLDAPQPRASFVHPSDESSASLDDESARSPASGSSSTTSTSRNRSSYSSNSTDSTVLPDRTPHPKSPPTSAPTTGSTITRRATTGQQLYASSLAFGSKSLSPRSPLACRDSVSSSFRGSNSDPENSHGGGPVPASYKSSNSDSENSHGVPVRSPYHHHPARQDSISPTSPGSSAGPAFPVYRNSHDPRNFFDLTRPSQGTRKYRPDETSPTLVASQSASLPPTPQLTRRASSHGSTRSVTNTPSTYTNNNPVSASQPTSPQAQALYHPSVYSNPTSPPSRPPISPNRNNYFISIPLTGGVSRNLTIEPIQKRPQPIYITDHPPDNCQFYTAITEDETLKLAPDSKSLLYSPIAGITEDNLLVFPSPAATPAPAKRHSYLSQVIDVRDVQNPDPPRLSKLLRTNSVPPLRIRKKNYVGDALVLQQPRPSRPLSGLPAQLNIQVADLDSSEDAAYYAESFQRKGKEKGSYGFAAIFEVMDRLTRTRRDSGVIGKDT